MKIKTSDFFPYLYTVSGVTDEDYRQVAAQLNDKLELLSLASNCGYYVVDYYRKNFLCVSENIAYWCGLPTDKVKDIGLELFFKYVQDDYLKKLIEIHTEWCKKLQTTPIEDWTVTSLVFDFSFQFAGADRMINQKVVPYSIKNGKVWLEICFLTLSSVETSEYAIMKKRNADLYFEYSFKEHVWSRKEIKRLSGKENEVFLLSVRGFACKQIADMLGRSEETVKGQRKTIMKKLGVQSFASAAIHVMNYGLLPM